MIHRIAVCLCVVPAIVLAADKTAKGNAAEYQAAVRPFLAKNCVACHNDKAKTGGLSFDDLRDPKAAIQADAVWDKVLKKITTGQMPPKGLPRPKAEEVAPVTAWIETVLARADRNRKPEPGRLTAHRLNRFEYNNVIHDLLAVDFRPADDFPADDSGYGFDNIGDVLSLSPVLMEKYLAAADRISRLAIPPETFPKPTVSRLKQPDTIKNAPSIRSRHRFPVDAEYGFRINVAGPRPTTGTQALDVALWSDSNELHRFHLDVDRQKPRIFDVRLPIRAGDRQIRASIVNREENAGVGIDSLEIRGPFAPDEPELPESYRRIFPCGHGRGEHTQACIRPALGNLARRAWRRPVTDEEVERLTRFVSMGDSLEEGMRVALQAILVSPHFLFRLQKDPVAGIHPIDDIDLASRLSFFVWSSIPDDELLQEAERHTLRKNLAVEVRRMLRDPKSDRLVENFAGQWLELRNLDSVKPDPVRFPEFDDDLRQAMRQETLRFFSEVVHQDRSILDFLDGKFTYLNERLAKHYGISGVTGSEFRRVELPEGVRSGILTQASILTVTSYPNRTSPVLRGKWLLENILNAPPPPPPPDAGALDEKQVNLAGTVRQQFEAHRANPACASCHVRMDPLGFAFENFDAVGAWRTHEGKFPVDASGTLPTGQSFTGASGLKTILRTEKDEFAECLAEKMLTYALGRGLERYDRPAIQQITKKMAAENERFSSMILAIASSLPFQMGRGDGGNR